MFVSRTSASPTTRLRLLNEPAPVPIPETTASGAPRTVVLRGRRHSVTSVVEQWRLDEGWWRSNPISRHYYRLQLDDDLLLTVFFDRVRSSWWTQQAITHDSPGLAPHGAAGPRPEAASNAAAPLATSATGMPDMNEPGDAPGADVYVELHLRTSYSLLEGASQPRELAELAKQYRYSRLAITDRNNLYGAMVFAQRCRDAGIQPIIGVELTVATDGEAARHELTLLAENREGYANLCRLVSLANGWGLQEQADRERRRNDPQVTPEQLRSHTTGVICLTGGRSGELAQRIDAGDRPGAEATLQRWIDWFGRDNVWVELHDNLVLGDRPRIRAQVALARQLGVGIVATGDVQYHHQARHRLHDALCAIRHRTTLDGCHVQRRPNSEFHLRQPIEQAERFAEWPDAIHNSVRIADRCTFDLLDDLGYRLPTPPVDAEHTPDSWLRELCEQRLAQRYGPSRQATARKRLDEELRLITHHQLAGFFLVYHEVLGLARDVAGTVRGDTPRAALNMAPGRGRGSSVSSIVCYLIGLSHIDPIENDLFLGRFLNESMTTLPDIDLDFPRDIRDQLFQRVYAHWGTDHAALVATFPRYRIRSAVRDLGKALGLPNAEIDRLAKLAEGYSSANNVKAEMEQIPELRHLVDNPSWMHLIDLAAQLANFPRHVSQHVGGVVISSDPLIDCVPIQPTAWPGRYVCQWDKDDIDDAHMVKIDFLALGMLSLVEDCLDLCYEHRDGDLVDLSRIDFEDPVVFDRICRGDTMGVFQIESRAQAGILPRTQPRRLDDLTAQVAIIRPGPIVGGAVSRYVEGRADPRHNQAFQHECLDGVLDRTFGVVLFQEQVVQVAMNMGKFDSGMAEQFRRAMGRKDWDDEAQEQWWEKFRSGAAQHGVSDADARSVFDALTGFAEFGFPESHAAAFGLLAYQTAWLREYYPAEFYCALYNNWPMGFYPPHVFTNDARRHGVQILRPEINTSEAKCTVVRSASSPVAGRAADRMPPFHGTGTIRIGLSHINGMGAATVNAILHERRRGGPFQSLRDFARRTQLGGEAIENAIRAGVFDELGPRRRELLWQQWLLVRQGRSTAELEQPARPRQLQLDLPTEQDHVPLDDVTDYQAMVDDYEVLGLSPTAHPMQFLRTGMGPLPDSRRLLDVPVGRWAETAGLVVVRQRPGTARGTVYLLLEDEKGVINIVVSPRLYDRYRPEIRGNPFLRISGIIEPPAGDTPVLRARTITRVHHGALRAPSGKSWG